LRFSRIPVWTLWKQGKAFYWQVCLVLRLTLARCPFEEKSAKNVSISPIIRNHVHLVWENNRCFHSNLALDTLFLWILLTKNWQTPMLFKDGDGKSSRIKSNKSLHFFPFLVSINLWFVGIEYTCKAQKLSFGIIVDSYFVLITRGVPAKLIKHKKSH